MLCSRVYPQYIFSLFHFDSKYSSFFQSSIFSSLNKEEHELFNTSSILFSTNSSHLANNGISWNNSLVEMLRNMDYAIGTIWWYILLIFRKCKLFFFFERGNVSCLIINVLSIHIIGHIHLQFVSYLYNVNVYFGAVQVCISTHVSILYDSLSYLSIYHSYFMLCFFRLNDYTRAKFKMKNGETSLDCIEG